MELHPVAGIVACKAASMQCPSPQEESAIPVLKKDCRGSHRELNVYRAGTCQRGWLWSPPTNAVLCHSAGCSPAEQAPLDAD